MDNIEIFEYAESVSTGRIVHIDDADVANGIHCNCICPACKEPLQARHGDIRQHGFAHSSEKSDSSGLNVPPKTGTNVPPVAE